MGARYRFGIVSGAARAARYRYKGIGFNTPEGSRPAATARCDGEERVSNLLAERRKPPGSATKTLDLIHRRDRALPLQDVRVDFQTRSNQALRAKH